MERSLAFYASLGFQTRIYRRSHQYGFATWGDVEIHVGGVPSGLTRTPVTIYLFVADADLLAQRWRATGAQVHAPEDTEWGQREGVIVDPDGNTIRFGSPISR
ncbi:MAG: VOC family protein [Actinobacteria bacterium]|nr:VOC family protein [Actinomycetota bacterium]